MIERTAWMKCVVGRAWPNVWAQAGMPAKGNMKPDRRMEGRKMKKVICMACIWLRATVENKKPSERLTRMKSETAARKASGEPRKGTPNKRRAPASRIATWIEPTKT